MAIRVLRPPRSKFSTVMRPDKSLSHNNGLTAYWLFNKATGTVPNIATALGTGSATLNAGISRGIDAGGQCIIGTNATNSYASTTLTAANLKVDAAKSRTIFVRFKPAAASSSTNNGGLFTVGTYDSASNTFLTIRQSQNPTTLSANDWVVDWGNGTLPFTISNTSGRVHDLVITYDGSTITIFVDGLFNTSQVASLNTSGSDAFGVGRSYYGAADNAKYYFNGKIYECGVVEGTDWVGHEARTWHTDPYVLLSPGQATVAGLQTSSNLDITLSGIASTATIGSLVLGDRGAAISFTGLTSTETVGNLAIANVTGLQFVTAVGGIASTAAIGDLRVRRQGGIWQTVDQTTGDWTVVEVETGI